MVLGEVGVALGDHRQLGVVVDHRVTDDKVAHAHAPAHVARNAGKHQRLCAKYRDEQLGRRRGVHFAHARAAQGDLLRPHGAGDEIHPGNAPGLCLLQLGGKQLYFVGQCAHDPCYLRHAVSSNGQAHTARAPFFVVAATRRAAFLHLCFTR
ncbi:hypothetical protein SDC9_120241 [bioreactor metagenome]|uniref:Uncharacterized protein n=1 Tax=bioreactor metagenome TaxID=1076179 RepID=A0A645C6R6_9ZZZZ